MAKVQKDNTSDYYNVDDGVYKAVVVDIDEMTGDRGPYYRWKFKILDPVYEEEEIEGDVFLSGMTPAKLKDGSKLDKWLVACGVSSEDGDVIDTDDAVGSKVRVMVEQREGKNDTIFSNVTKVSRPLGKKSKTKEENKEESKKAKKQETKKEKLEEDEKPEKKEKKSSKADSDDDDLWDFD